MSWARLKERGGGAMGAARAKGTKRAAGAARTKGRRGATELGGEDGGRTKVQEEVGGADRWLPSSPSFLWPTDAMAAELGTQSAPNPSPNQVWATEAVEP